MAANATGRCCCSTMTASPTEHAGCRAAAPWLAAASLALLGPILATPAWPQDPAPDRVATSAPLEPYNARYAIYRNGKLTGKVEVELSRQGEGEHARWLVRSEGSGTHGLARVLAARDNEEVIGRLQSGGFQPLRYTRHTRVAGIDDRWAVDFNWTDRRVSVFHGNGTPLVLDMMDDALDPLSLKLEMRRLLRQPNPRLRFEMVEEDEIEEQYFRLLPREWLETSLGCLETVPVEKVHHNSKRYTRAWHAPDFDFIEVRLEHGKIDGNHLEMRITELSLGGRDVVPRAGCAARQARPPTTGEDPGGGIP